MKVIEPIFLLNFFTLKILNLNAMSNFDKIPEPVSLIFIDNVKHFIYYKENTNAFKRFDMPEPLILLLPKPFKAVEIQSGGFYWKGKTDIDEVYLGKDTIADYSKEISFTEMLDILRKLRDKRKIKVSDFFNSISPLF